MEKINTQERKIIGLYRELSKEHQHKAISYLKDSAKVDQYNKVRPMDCESKSSLLTDKTCERMA